MLRWQCYPERQLYSYECGRPGCLYREWIPAPKAVPELDILLLDSDTIQASAVVVE